MANLRRSHESGHTFGAVHDCTTDTCASGSSECCPLSSSTCDAGGRYIMNPVSSTSLTQFSPCTVGNVCSGFQSRSVRTSCLVDNYDGVITEDDGGNCLRGKCEQINLADNADNDNGNSQSSWIDRHRRLVIGLGAGVGGALVMALLMVVICCCRRRRK